MFGPKEKLWLCLENTFLSPCICTNYEHCWYWHWLLQNQSKHTFIIIAIVYPSCLFLFQHIQDTDTMGNMCSSLQLIRENGGMIVCPSTTKVIHENGRVQEFKNSIKASYILSRNPNYFLCSSESMYIGSYAPQVPVDDNLQLGQIYFLMPSSKSQVPISLKDLCSMAVKASATLQDTSTRVKIIGVESDQCCNVLSGRETRMSSRGQAVRQHGGD